MKTSLSLFFISGSVFLASFLTSTSAHAARIFNPLPQPICPAWGCDGPPIVIIDQNSLQDGYWGSNAASMQVDDQGATIQLGCQVGIITGQILVIDGQFSVQGILKSALAIAPVDPTGDPIESSGTPTTFTGVVNGDSLDLSFDGQIYNLEFNAQAGPVVCE